MSLVAVDRLSRLIDVYGARYRTVSDDRVHAMLERRRPLLIFGAGQNGEIVLKAMRAAGLEPVGFIDDTPAKIGTTFHDLPIVTLEAACALDAPTVVVSVFTPGADYLAIAGRLKTLGAEPIGLFAFLWACDAGGLPFYFLDRPETVAAAESSLRWLATRLVDQESEDVLCGHVEFRLSLRYEALPPWSTTRADLPAAWQGFEIVDAGAFDGDTLLPLLQAYGPRISRAFAIEPDPVTFDRLSSKLHLAGAEAAGKVELIRAAVDESVGRRTFANVGNQGSSFGDDGIAVNTVSVDSVMAEAPRPDAPLFIKYDVEGAEAAALRGTRETIRRRRPFLSVAAYHKPADLWELAQMISDVDDSYRFMLRSHGADGADLNLYGIAGA